MQQTFLAYSLPGTTDHYVATVADSIQLAGEDVDKKVDFVLRPFTSSNEVSLGFRILAESKNTPFNLEPYSDCNILDTTKESYRDSFRTIRSEIQQGLVEKAVLSRCKSVTHQSLDIYKLFRELNRRYESSFTYVVSDPNIGIWMGSTPELILARNRTCYTTTAVAATRPVSQQASREWNTKEKAEHEFINRYLREEFDKAGINYMMSDVSEVIAGPVMHLSNEIRLGLEHDPKVLMDILHPGPALSGYPTQKAINLIAKIESHQRRFYTGYLGLVRATDLQLYANIRCMQIYNDQCTLYLGGGITIDSEYESEWVETENKAKTLLEPMLELGFIKAPKKL